MKYYQEKLFSKISKEEFESMRVCLSVREMTFYSGDMIASFGSGKKHVGILISGLASTMRYELNGSRTILECLGSQDIFGEVFPFQNTQYESMPITCDKDYSVLFFGYDHILSPCFKVCPCHQQLVQNMFQILPEKAIFLEERMEALSKRSIRGKLVCYFFHLAEKAGSNQLAIPFTMVDLAGYLSVDRSAMTRELKEMKDNGFITMEHCHATSLSLDAITNSLSRFRE